MKKVAAIIIFILLFLGFTSTAFAQTSGRYRMNEVSTLDRDETINGNYFAAGEKVEVLGTVNGDIYVAGGFVIVEGVVNGDVLAAGGNVIISGKVSGDVRVAAGEIDIENDIAGAATVFGGSIDIDDDASIGKGLVVAAGNVNVDGDIDGDIDASVGNLRVSDKARVSGEIVRHEKQIKEDKWEFDGAAAAAGVKMFFTLTSFITTLLVGILGLKFFPNYFRRGAEIVQTQAGKSLAVGLLGIIVTPIIIIMLLMSVIGIPFAIALSFFFVAYLVLSPLYVVLWAGEWIMKKLNQTANVYLAFVVGAIAYCVVMLIPFLGGLVGLFVTLIGFGAMLINKKHNYILGRKEKVY